MFNKNINFRTEFNSKSDEKTAIYKLIFLIARYSPKNDNNQLAPQKLLYCNQSFSRFWTHFNGRPKILTYRQIPPNIFYLRLSYFFLSGFSFTEMNSRGREETIFYFTLPLPPAHEHSDIYLQLCM